jgi:hypothetical protein
MKSKKTYSFKIILLVVVIFLAILTRLYKIDSTLTDWFSWRQSDTAAVGRMFQRNGFNILKPQYYDLSNIQSGVDNPEGLRLVEFPIYSFIFAKLHQAYPSMPLEVWGRLIAVAFSVLAAVCIFLLLESKFGLLEAFFGALFFALNPFVVFYSRTILPDMPATAMAFLAIYLASLYRSKGFIMLLFSSLSLAIALLIKPTVIFYTIAVFYFLYQKKHSGLLKTGTVIISALIVFLPVTLWRLYIQQFPEGVPVSEWLLTSANTPDGLQSIFFRPAFFRWLFFERISQLIMGGYLTFFLLLGLLFEPIKNRKVVWLLFFTALTYLLTFQGGNVQHEYYQIVITPVLAILIGVGVGNYLRQKKAGYLIIRSLVVFVIFALSFFFSFYQVKNKYDEQPNLVLIADVVRSLTQPKDLIVTDTQGDTTLLYLSDRRGYPAPYRELPILKEQGASYFITQNMDYKESLSGEAALVFENNQVLIFQL